MSSDEIRHHLQDIEHHICRLSAPAMELGATHTFPPCTESHAVQAPDNGETQSRILKPGGENATPRDTVLAQRAGGEPQTLAEERILHGTEFQPLQRRRGKVKCGKYSRRLNHAYLMEKNFWKFFSLKWKIVPNITSEVIANVFVI